MKFTVIAATVALLTVSFLTRNVEPVGTHNSNTLEAIEALNAQ